MAFLQLSHSRKWFFSLLVNVSRSSEPFQWLKCWWCEVSALAGVSQNVCRSIVGSFIVGQFKTLNCHGAVELWPTALLLLLLPPHLAGSSLPARYIGDAWLAAGHGGDLQPAGLQQVQGGAADSVTTAEDQEVIWPATTFYQRHFLKVWLCTCRFLSCGAQTSVCFALCVYICVCVIWCI